jgi:hypothetical protein
VNVEPRETRYYKYPGLVRVILERGNDGAILNRDYLGGTIPWSRRPTRLLSDVSRVEVQFDRRSAITWQDGLRRIGLTPAMAQKVFTLFDPVATAATYKGAELRWVPKVVVWYPMGAMLELGNKDRGTTGRHDRNHK